MVTFKFVEENDKFIIFWYYPEGHTDKRPGTIIVDKEADEIDVTELAEEDWETDIPVEELNKFPIFANEERKLQGRTDFIPLFTEPEHIIHYGDHALDEILMHLREGEVPKEGMQTWY